ncbi:uncharacterized protein LOC130403195 [Gadus chalcogrammus]|uniref:uncharacterized protein LOC130403195 n=1 Tax=Gadus chalcogrammus TaxID=1042646 RepID=UPI0024C4DDEE|nr:uncharacterized protein LOC130403195 [Gadus chalcogrammus]
MAASGSRVGLRWGDSEVECLLEIWADDSIQSQLDTTHKNSGVFGAIRDYLEHRGYHRTMGQCRDKVKKLRFQYLRVRDALRRSGLSSDEKGRFPWYDAVDLIIGHKTSSVPRVLESSPVFCRLECTTEDNKRETPLKVALCRRRRKGLRDKYIREVRKEKQAIKSGEIVGSQGSWRHTADRAFLMEPPGAMKNWTGGGGDHSNTEPELPVVNGEVHGCEEKPAEIEVKTEDVEDEPEEESTAAHGMGSYTRALSEPTVQQSSAKLFCQSIVPHLERLPLEKLIQVQIQILQVVQDATGS